MVTPSTRSMTEAERKLMDVVDRRVSEVVDRLVERQDKLDGQFAEMMQALAAINGQLRRQPLKAEEGEALVGMGGWLMRAEFFFEVAKMPERGRVRVAAIHMEGKALQWHRGFMNLQGEAGYANLDCYVSALGARFGAQAYKDPLADLRNLRQSGSLQEYMEAFDELYPRTGIREDQALSFFLSGLVDELQMPVRMFKPKRLAEAFSLAKLQELTVRALGEKPKGSSGGGQSGMATYSGTKSLAVTATTLKSGDFLELRHHESRVRVEKYATSFDPKGDG
ncbi:uncharacterized protein LOC121774473 [Salvia splendens]|uniref:uncharacterized protein LOC121774473 n=1 Tax=Salvia splendens TaxID=180675 RepID=UPI001C273201|nr:uncharacterized protein LOC121774473 [Salvia splendens]